MNSINMFLGFLIISLACTFDKNKVSFFLSLVASVFLGTVSAFGESTTLGFCKGFPSTVVGYFGSGTGFAGVFGSGMILALKSADLSNGTIFFCIMPSVIPYFLAFWWINNMKSKYPYVLEVPALSQTTVSSPNNYLSMTDDEIIEEKIKIKKNYNPTNQDIFSEQAGLTSQGGAVQEFDEAKNNKNLTCQELIKIVKKVGFF